MPCISPGSQYGIWPHWRNYLLLILGCSPQTCINVFIIDTVGQNSTFHIITQLRIMSYNLAAWWLTCGAPHHLYGAWIGLLAIEAKTKG